MVTVWVKSSVWVPLLATVSVIVQVLLTSGTTPFGHEAVWETVNGAAGAVIVKVALARSPSNGRSDDGAGSLLRLDIMLYENGMIIVLVGVGSGVFVGSGVLVGSGVFVGSGVLVGSGVRVATGPLVGKVSVDTGRLSVVGVAVGGIGVVVAGTDVDVEGGRVGTGANVGDGTAVLVAVATAGAVAGTGVAVAAPGTCGA